jgi:hypothetical protein
MFEIHEQVYFRFHKHRTLMNEQQDDPSLQRPPPYDHNDLISPSSPHPDLPYKEGDEFQDQDSTDYNSIYPELPLEQGGAQPQNPYPNNPSPYQPTLFHEEESQTQSLNAESSLHHNEAHSQNQKPIDPSLIDPSLFQSPAVISQPEIKNVSPIHPAQNVSASGSNFTAPSNGEQVTIHTPAQEAHQNQSTSQGNKYASERANLPSNIFSEFGKGNGASSSSEKQAVAPVSVLATPSTPSVQPAFGLSASQANVPLFNPAMIPNPPSLAPPQLPLFSMTGPSTPKATQPSIWLHSRISPQPPQMQSPLASIPSAIRSPANNGALPFNPYIFQKMQPLPSSYRSPASTAAPSYPQPITHPTLTSHQPAKTDFQQMPPKATPKRSPFRNYSTLEAFGVTEQTRDYDVGDLPNAESTTSPLEIETPRVSQVTKDIDVGELPNASESPVVTSNVPPITQLTNDVDVGELPTVSESALISSNIPPITQFTQDIEEGELPTAQPSNSTIPGEISQPTWDIQGQSPESPEPTLDIQQHVDPSESTKSKLDIELAEESECPKPSLDIQEVEAECTQTEPRFEATEVPESPKMTEDIEGTRASQCTEPELGIDNTKAKCSKPTVDIEEAEVDESPNLTAENEIALLRAELQKKLRAITARSPITDHSTCASTEAQLRKQIVASKTEKAAVTRERDALQRELKQKSDDLESTRRYLGDPGMAHRNLLGHLRRSSKKQSNLKDEISSFNQKIRDEKVSSRAWAKKAKEALDKKQSDVDKSVRDFNRREEMLRQREEAFLRAETNHKVTMALSHLDLEAKRMNVEQEIQEKKSQFEAYIASPQNHFLAQVKQLEAREADFEGQRSDYARLLSLEKKFDDQEIDLLEKDLHIEGLIKELAKLKAAGNDITQQARESKSSTEKDERKHRESHPFPPPQQSHPEQQHIGPRPSPGAHGGNDQLAQSVSNTPPFSGDQVSSEKQPTKKKRRKHGSRGGVHHSKHKQAGASSDTHGSQLSTIVESGIEEEIELEKEDYVSHQTERHSTGNECSEQVQDIQAADEARGEVDVEQSNSETQSPNLFALLRDPSPKKSHARPLFKFRIFFSVLTLFYFLWVTLSMIQGQPHAGTLSSLHDLKANVTERSGMTGSVNLESLDLIDDGDVEGDFSLEDPWLQVMESDLGRYYFKSDYGPIIFMPPHDSYYHAADMGYWSFLCAFVALRRPFGGL